MNNFPVRLTAGALVAGALALGIAGPAGALDTTQTANQIVQAAISATEAATSVTFIGTVKQGKQITLVNVAASSDGDGQGSIAIGQGKATVRAVNGIIYFMGTTKFWQQQSGESAAQLFAGKWVSTAATSSNGKNLAQFVNLHLLFQSVFGGSLTSSTFTKRGAGKIGKQRAYVVSGVDHSDGSGGKIYVATKGQPYVLRIVIQGSSGTGTLNFTRFNAPVHPVAPSNAINLDTLNATSTTS